MKTLEKRERRLKCKILPCIMLTADRISVLEQNKTPENHRQQYS